MDASVYVVLAMEGGKEALEDLAREMVALYGRDARRCFWSVPRSLRNTATLQARAWREIAAIAARFVRNL